MPEMKSERKRITSRFIYLSFLSKWDSCPTKLVARTMYKCCYSIICWTTEMTMLSCSPMNEKVAYPPVRCRETSACQRVSLSEDLPPQPLLFPCHPRSTYWGHCCNFWQRRSERGLKELDATSWEQAGPQVKTQTCLAASGLFFGRLGFSAFSHLFVSHLQMYLHVSKHISEQRRVN